MEKAFLNGRLVCLLGDITELAVDAIVNAANNSLLGGGGVDGAIHRRAGPDLLAECRLLGGCSSGSVKLTKGYDLPAKHVIHTVGPVFGAEKGREEELLAACYRNALATAEKEAFANIAFPSISTGAYGYPVKQAAETASSVVVEWLSKNGAPQTVFFVLHSEQDFDIYCEAVHRLL